MQLFYDGNEVQTDILPIIVEYQIIPGMKWRNYDT